MYFLSLGLFLLGLVGTFLVAPPKIRFKDKVTTFPNFQDVSSQNGGVLTVDEVDSIGKHNDGDDEEVVEDSNKRQEE